MIPEERLPGGVVAVGLSQEFGKLFRRSRRSQPHDSAAHDKAEAAAGLALLRLHADSASWVSRRVDKYIFVDDTSIRRAQSVDFRVPADAPRIQVGDEVRRLIPLTRIQKGLIADFDLRDEHDGALTLLPSLQTDRIFADGLIAYARFQLRSIGVGLDDAVAEDLRLVAGHVTKDKLQKRQEAIKRLSNAAAEVGRRESASQAGEAASQAGKAASQAGKAASQAGKAASQAGKAAAQAGKAAAQAGKAAAEAVGGRAAAEAAKAASEAGKAASEAGKAASEDEAASESPPKTADDQRFWLMQRHRFRSQLQEVEKNHLVIVELDDRNGQHRLLKIRYEQTLTEERGRLAFLGWRPHVVRFQGVAGREESYHLEVAAPPGIEILRLAVFDEAPTPSQEVECVPGFKPHVHLRAEPNESAQNWVGTVYMRVSRQGWLMASYVVVLIAALLLLGGSRVLSRIAAPASASVSATSAVSTGRSQTGMQETGPYRSDPPAKVTPNGHVANVHVAARLRAVPGAAQGTVRSSNGLGASASPNEADTAATLLLALLGAAATYLTRPVPHSLAGKLLRGARGLTIGAVLLTLVGAISLVMWPDGAFLHHLWYALAGSAFVIWLLLSMTVWLPRKRVYQRQDEGA
jgi:hypothetical protein